MGAYILGRLVQVPAPLLAVSIVVFLALRLSGDPVELLLGAEATPEQRAELRRQLGLDDPLVVQYARFLGQALTGDFGESLRFKQPAMQLVLDRLPNTLLLGLLGLVLAALLGIAMGVVAATRRGSPLDVGLMSMAVFGQSMPSFWLGILLILLFAVTLRWLPSSGAGEPRHLVLPAITLSFFILPQVLLLTRSAMLDVLGEGYVQVARAKGLSERAVTLRHALRNSLYPIVTYIGLQFGTLMGGSIVTETVFAWPGLGQLTIQSIFNRDLPVVQAAVFVMALAIVLSNLLADVANGLLDPRLSR